MFKVKVLTQGKCKEAWLQEALLEYEKRLTGRLRVEWVLAKSEEELIYLVSHLKEPYIALDPKGLLFSSEALSKKMQEWGSQWTFVIGGAEGLCQKILEKAKLVWSLSPLTFTHQMTRLILVEQLYRALEIEKGSSYHK